MTEGGWKIFEASMPVLTCEYRAGPVSAQALAVGGAEGVFVVSPPARADDALYAALAPYGRVVGLVAPNAFHHLGLPEWKRHFPGATVYAPAQAVARVRRKTRIAEVAALAQAAGPAGASVSFVDLPHYRTGEALVRVRSGRGLVWYLTDCMTNMRALPPNPVVSLVYRLSRSAPGVRFNRFAALFMMKDKRAVQHWLAQEFAREPPRWIVPAHGEIIDVSAQGAAIAQALGAA